MTSLWWPGDHRAGTAMSDRALVDAMVRVETVWLAVLADLGVAPAEAAADLSADDLDVAALTIAAEDGGNPVIPLVATLREALPTPASTWLHRGLTSQDVLDTAVMLCVGDALAQARAANVRQVSALADLVRAHRETAMVARTLTQPAVPMTFAMKAASWLDGVLDAADDLAAVRLPVQLGGAAGTLAAVVELAGTDVARVMPQRLAAGLGLDIRAPWHTNRAPVTRCGDACVRMSAAWARIANDVLALGRAEVGELAEGVGGGSSTMPHKSNPVLSVLVRRHALEAPGLGATLHAAAADQRDERAAGGWHAEWATLANLVRHTVVAAHQTVDLVAGLQVHTDQMAANLTAHETDLRAEQRSITALTGRRPQETYTGLAGDIIDAVLDRAAAFTQIPEEN